MNDPSAIIKQTKIGDGCTIEKDSIVLNSILGYYVDIEKRNLIRKAEIGDMTYTGAETSIMWAKVGKYCNIARHVNIGGNEHNYNAASMEPTYRIRNKLAGKITKHHDEEIITVGNDVWIGQGASVLRKSGLTIGDGCVIGSGAVVTKSIPPYAIVVGNPAHILKFRFTEEIISILLEARWWDWPFETVVRNWDLLSADLTPEIAKQILLISYDN